MSSTRKIPGWVDGILTTRETKDIASVHLFAHKHVPDMVRATTIIGGKGYTEEEHEAEFQRRAKAMVEAGNEMRRIIASRMNIGIDTMYATQAWDEATIQLP